ncbi:MAG: hypothetical protein HFH14_03740 [Lachnospiraceae bacterium]|nr:hypothetical protein [Lachnospiraceae bacterium]
MIIRKKIPYYVLAVIAFLVLAMCSPLRMIGMNNEMISVISALIHLPKKVLYESSAQDALDAPLTQWMYTLFPIAVSIPSASYIYEEIKSRIYMYVEIRKGKYRYIYARFIYSAVSAAVTVSVGFAAYALAIYCIFPLNIMSDTEIIGLAPIGVWDFVWYMLKIIMRMSLYAMAMSTFLTFIIYLYPNLYVDISLMYITAHILRDVTMTGNITAPLAILITMAALYGVMWKFRSERI